MVRRLVVVAALAVALLVGAAVPALAEDVAPGGGNQFGSTWRAWPQSMPSPMGLTLGACVSAMAQGVACPHAYP